MRSLLYGNDDPVFHRKKVIQDENCAFTVASLEAACWANAEPIRKIFREAFGYYGESPKGSGGRVSERVHQMCTRSSGGT